MQSPVTHSDTNKDTNIIMNDNRLYCAVDTDDLQRAKYLASQIKRAGACMKLGLQFFNAHGPQGVSEITQENPDLPVFLDLKYHDIPNTVAQAVRAAVPLGVQYLNVHASGGMEMMKAAKQAAAEEAGKLGITAPKILAVTILTSLDQNNLEQVGYKYSTQEQVIRLAQLTQDAGLDGIVCSPHEIKAVRSACGDDFALMVPGIRPASHESGSDDQKRVMTPSEAISAGATHIVVGRPITNADSPAEAAKAILEQISA